MEPVPLITFQKIGYFTTYEKKGSIGESAVLRTNEYTTGKIHISIGIPPGPPLSPILFLFHNSPLLEKLSQENEMSAVGFVDDIAILIEENGSKGNCNQSLNAHENICKPWADRHWSKFAPDKYQLSHLTRKRTADLEQPLVLPERTVFPAHTITYLGVVLDTKLL